MREDPPALVAAVVMADVLASVVSRRPRPSPRRRFRPPQTPRHDVRHAPRPSLTPNLAALYQAAANTALCGRGLGCGGLDQAVPCRDPRPATGCTLPANRPTSTLGSGIAPPPAGAPPRPRTASHPGSRRIGVVIRAPSRLPVRSRPRPCGSLILRRRSMPPPCSCGSPLCRRTRHLPALGPVTRIRAPRDGRAPQLHRTRGKRSFRTRRHPLRLIPEARATSFNATERSHATRF